MKILSYDFLNRAADVIFISDIKSRVAQQSEKQTNIVLRGRPFSKCFTYINLFRAPNLFQTGNNIQLSKMSLKQLKQ